MFQQLLWCTKEPNKNVYYLHRNWMLDPLHNSDHLQACGAKNFSAKQINGNSPLHCLFGKVTEDNVKMSWSMLQTG